MEPLGSVYEEIRVRAGDLAGRVQDIIHEGNVRRVIIKDGQGVTFIEIPLSIATLAVITAPVLAAVGAIATALSDFTVVVERVNRSAAAARSTGATSGFGATEENMDMKGTIGQRIDAKGTKLEDLGGVGGHDSKGG